MIASLATCSQHLCSAGDDCEDCCFDRAAIAATTMLTLTQRLPANPEIAVSFTLALTATDRTRSRQQLTAADGQLILLRLSRGTVLKDSDILQSETGDTLVRVSAKPEPVFVVTASTPLDLLRAAYHLGNRHIPLEITANYLRLSPDPVLRTMLEQLKVEVEEAVLPFQPETGAYGNHHAD